MLIKTKKYQLDNATYRKIGMQAILSKQWWIPLAIFVGIIGLNLLLNLVYSNIWIYFLAPIAVLGYYLFWYIQFTGAPHLDKMKTMFERYNYEINGREIMIKKSAREGMKIEWPMIRRAEKAKEGYILYFSKVQFLYLPFKIFNSNNDTQFMDAILRKKKLIKEPEAA